MREEISTENISIAQVSNLASESEEKQGEIYRFCYLEDGENVIILDEADEESLQRHTTDKANSDGKIRYSFSVKCVSPSGNTFRLFLSSFDGVAFTVPYRLVKNGIPYRGKVKAVRLTDSQVGSGNLAYRNCTTQSEMLQVLLEHTKSGKCRLKVKIVAVGAENPDSDKTEVAVERDWTKNDKVYTLKWVKYLYAISFVD